MCVLMNFYYYMRNGIGKWKRIVEALTLNDEVEALNNAIWEFVKFIYCSSC